MRASAIVFEAPEAVALREVTLAPMGDDDVLVDVSHSAISSGTERLFWSGSMPPFPGMGYPLVPGYEAVGRVVEGALPKGTPVFVPGSRAYTDVRGLFGGSAERLVVPAARAITIESDVADMTLLALAATAAHAIARGGLPDLVVGHGVLGRLIARIAVALGTTPTVHEVRGNRSETAGYPVVHPDADERRDYTHIIDASGDPAVIDSAVERLGRGGRLTLAGFYPERLSFAFPQAFMKEVDLVFAAEWTADDLTTVQRLLSDGALSLSGLITHTAAPADAAAAYRTAFTDPDCLKMVLTWRQRP